MTDAAFDTLAVTRQLKSRGFDAEQAEAITEAVRTGVTGGVATKADMAELRGEIKADMAQLRGEMEVKFAEIDGRFGQINERFNTVRSDILWVKWFCGVIITLLAVPILQDLMAMLN